MLPGSAGEYVLNDSAFWRGRRVLITGHTGFKGGWLTLWLASMGSRVIGYALAPNTTPSLFNLALAGHADCDSRIADVRDYATLKSVLLETRPDTVFHLAAQPLVRRSYAMPRETYETNVMGTVNLLDAVREAESVRAVVVVTSDKCYENREWHWGYREDEPMGGHDPYSNSKGCAELVTAAMRNSFFSAGDHSRAAVATARAGNVIGGGDWSEDRLIPDLLRAISSGQPANIRNPGAIRPWQHVLEPLSGYLLLARRLHEQGQTHASAWNFGPADEDALTVAQIADHMVRRWGPPAAWTQDGQSHPHEARYLKLDSSKSRALLGWKPRLRAADALDWVVDWQRALANGENARITTLDQINRYINRTAA
jgi:CDP-glucose 4,6-dehydratase